MMSLKGKLRTATVADVSELLAIYAPYVEKSTISFEWNVPTEAEFSSRVEHVLRKYPYIVYEENEQILGYAYADRAFERYSYRFCAELSVYVREDARARGIGSLLYRALIALCREMRLQMLYGVVTNPNEPSFRLHERLGFKRVGYFPHAGNKFDRWLDVVWYGLMIGDDRPLPPDIISFRSFGAAHIDRIFQEQFLTKP